AQDYTYLQYVVLSMIFSDAKFTVLGDENQKLCENGSFNLFLNDITIDNSSTGSKKEKIIKQFNLTTNYRSSKEIVEFTNKIAGRKLCDYIERSSGKVKTEKANGLNDLYFKIDSALNDFKENGDFKNKTAIVVKNKDIAKHIFENINNENICLITEEKNIINKNCCIITLALAKGLEFDNVIVINNFENENTLYVACTRALHKLNLIDFK
ncbi:MAG: 3'-5' exonuclease, partial [Clostridia bacterium]